MIIINPYVFATPGPSAYTGLVAAAAPTIWWKLDETSGTTAADSGSAAKNGSLAGGASFATAGIAAASGFAGVGRGVDMATASATQIAVSSLSGAALNALGGGGSTGSWTIVLMVAGGAGQCYLASRSNDFAVIHNYVSGKVEFFATNYTGTDPRTGSQMDLSAVDTTTPHQIAYRYDNGNWSGILDGVEVFNVSRSFGLGVNTNFYLASSGGANEASRKYLDFQAYNRAVSTADLAAMWAQRNA